MHWLSKGAIDSSVSDLSCAAPARPINSSDDRYALFWCCHKEAQILKLY